MPKRFVIEDFETASACDLKKCGAWVYSEHVTTEVICLGWTIDGDEPVVRGRDELMWATLDPKLKARVLDPETMFIAHNAAFEKAIHRNQMMPLYGWPDIPDERWHDIMAVCAMKGLPMKLEHAVKAMGLPHVKDMEGSKITRAMSNYTTGKKKGGYSQITPERIARSKIYCGRDIEAELGLHRAVKGLGQSEREVWLLDQRINQRGVRLDMEFINDCQKIVDDTTEPLLARFKKITGDLTVQSPKFKLWLHEQGVRIPDLQKETVVKWLGGDIDKTDEDFDEWEYDDYGMHDDVLPEGSPARDALKIKQIIGSASIKKLIAMQNCTDSDGVARFLTQYHGAGPGRWAGRLFQPQNFPRPTVKIGDEPAPPEELMAAIKTRDYQWVEMMFGNPIEAVASSLRHTIIPRLGNRLTVGDFKTIECVIVLAIAGQHDRTGPIAAGQKPYVPMAEKIFKRKIDKDKDLLEYTVGKNTVLGCGFQMGAPKFRARYAPKESIEFAEAAVKAYRTEFAPMVPKLWYKTQDAAIECVWTGRRQTIEDTNIEYRMEDGWLTCRLPSGRKLWYRNPEPVRKAMPWDETDIRRGFTYKAQKTGQWKTVHAYGGLLVENIVQATARDLLVNSMFRCEENFLDIVLTVHDEIVIDSPDDNAKLLEQIMCDQPRWVQELQIPVGADCWSDIRYRK